MQETAAFRVKPHKWEHEGEMSSSSAGAKGGRWSRKQSLSVCITGPGQAAAEINPEIKLNGKEEETTDIHHISPPAEQNQIPGSVSSGSFSEGYTGEGAGSDTRMWYLGVRECPQKKVWLIYA